MNPLTEAQPAAHLPHGLTRFWPWKHEGEKGRRHVGAPPALESKKNVKILRKMRAELVNLQDFLLRARQGEVEVPAYAEYLQHVKESVKSLSAELDDAGSNRSDIIYRVQDFCEQILANPILQDPKILTDLSYEHLHSLDVLADQIRHVIFDIGYLTIPERLAEWVKRTRPGYYIPFHPVFEDEVPLEEDRISLLNHFAWMPNSLPGALIDPEAGLIYRCSDSFWRRMLHYSLLVLGLVGSMALVYFVSYLPIIGAEFKDTPLARLNNWIALLIGMMVHVGIAAGKRGKSQIGGLPAILSINRLPLVLDAKIGTILVKLFFGLFGLFCFKAMTGAEIGSAEAFLLGYSLDNFVELFGVGLDQRSSARLAVVKKKIGA